MEKDIGKIVKNSDTDIVLRIDDFGGKLGLTIREYVKSERYTGFTKAGTRIPIERFKDLKAMINSVDEKEIDAMISGSVPVEYGNQATLPKDSSGRKDTREKKDKKAKLNSVDTEEIEDMEM